LNEFAIVICGSLVNERLAEMRYGPDGTGQPVRGLQLGAYGWLEHLARDTDPVDMVTVPADLTAVFGTGQIPHDRNNAGYVHTPSPAHARTAAVLCAGYLANADSAKANVFAVNLSSERVRLAMTIADGMRQGQSLGALLGYRFERELHDRDAGLDTFIAGLRLKFPLRANKIEETAPAPDDPAAPESIEQVEARNVIDGLSLLRHANALRDSAPPADEQPDDYPFGFTDLPSASGPQVGHIRAEVNALRNALDTVADVAVAEGAHPRCRAMPKGRPRRSTRTPRKRSRPRRRWWRRRAAAPPSPTGWRCSSPPVSTRTTGTARPARRPSPRSTTGCRRCCPTRTTWWPW
jgi:hypothetical protein